jgi:hypothetical protein
LWEEYGDYATDIFTQEAVKVLSTFTLLEKSIEYFALLELCNGYLYARSGQGMFYLHS